MPFEPIGRHLMLEGLSAPLRAGTRGRPQVEVGPDDLLRLRYTSGTTGKAKAAMIAHRAYLASLETMLSVLPPLSPADRVLHASPLTHASAAYMYPVLWSGGASVAWPFHGQGSWQRSQPKIQLPMAPRSGSGTGPRCSMVRYEMHWRASSTNGHQQR